jgi:glycosyltransferase involved in cell wall biosynthesis
MNAPPNPRALFLSPEAPWPAVGGGALRSASLLEYLAKRYDVDLVVFREPGAPDPALSIPARLAREIRVLNLPSHSRSQAARVLRNAIRAVRGVPPLVDRFAGFAAELERFLEGRRYALGLIEHLWCAPYREQAARHCDRMVLDLHNIESVLMSRSAAVEGWPAASVFRRFERASLAVERRWLPGFDLLLAASEHDARLVRELAPESRVHVYPNALPSAAQPVVPEEEVIAFSGNFDYHPNADAVRFFSRRIWPALRRRWPRLTWRLIGKRPEAVRKWTAGDPRIQVLGPVDDAIDALARAQVIVAPVRIASGTRVKILEAWAAARPVVSTTVGAEGLSAASGEDLLLADDPEQFAAAVSSLLASRQERERLGRAGRRRFEKEFTWQAAWSGLPPAGL